MTKPTATHICFDRIIPAASDPVRFAHKNLSRAHFIKMAQQYNVRSEQLPNLDADHPVWRAFMAVIDHNKWPDGHVLTCSFLDGDPAWQARVQAKAKIWEQYANVSISFGEGGDTEVRISFFADSGSWSAIGTDCLNTTYFPKGQPTMNFGWLRSDTADEEYERVVVHEFGHALGCIHEHQQPNEHLDWNATAVYQAFSGPPNNWTKPEIDQNILQKYGAQGIDASVFDINSIMLYEFAGNLFQNGVGTPLNEHLSDLDKSMIAKMYPPTT